MSENIAKSTIVSEEKEATAKDTAGNLQLDKPSVLETSDLITDKNVEGTKKYILEEIFLELQNRILESEQNEFKLEGELKETVKRGRKQIRKPDTVFSEERMNATKRKKL